MTANTCRLFADHVLSSIIFANVLHQFFLWSEIPIHVHVPWLCKHTGIFDRDLNLQAAEINTFVALDDMQLLCTRVCVAHPAAIVESNRIDDERISFPLPNGVTEPGWIPFCRMSSCIASPACTATSPFTNGWNAQHGMRREMSYVPAARFVTVYRPSGLVIARTTTPVTLFFAWIGASGTAPFGPETTPVIDPLNCRSNLVI
jgi:hypothetical protein